MILLNFKIALASLRASRARTILTTIGVMIGVMSVLLILALGEGTRQKTTSDANQVASGTYILQSGSDRSNSGSIFEPQPTSPTSVLTERDLGTLKQIKGVVNASPVMPIEGSVRHKDNSASLSYLAGVDPSIFRILGQSYVDGSVFSQDSKGVVLGNSIAHDIFGTELAAGQIITIRGESYTVSGVLNASPLSLALIGTPINDTVFLPVSSAKNYTQGVAQFSRIFVQAPGLSMAAVGDPIVTNHNGERDFSVLTPTRLIQGDSTAFQTTSIATLITAGISLLIGGIGIMNIMLVNVSERTREIGIRKSIGATNRQIRAQFLIEAIAMSLSGGILGVLLAFAIAVIGGLFLPFGIIFTPTNVALSLGLALVVGIVFGLFPAAKAASKDPIQALRYYQ